MHPPILNHLDPGKPLTLEPMGTWPKSDHLFDQESIWAVQAAWAAGRPLLIQGEPGCGKSQLARAVAQAQQWVFIPTVIHHRSECTDLQWHFDAVARLGSAQLLTAKAAYAGATAAVYAAAGKAEVGQSAETTVTHSLNPTRFLAPGPLWWAVNWVSAKQQFEDCDNGVKSVQPIANHLATQDKAANERLNRLPDHPDGRVLLIDEIDKANVDLPNGLLEVLDNGSFSIPYLAQGHVSPDQQRSLVIITTNRERDLPQAFLRRCFVYNINVPTTAEAFKTWLLKRATAHFGERKNYYPDVAALAADRLWSIRQSVKQRQQTKPGLGEFLDLMRALTRLAADEDVQREKLQQIADFAFNKSQQVAT